MSFQEQLEDKTRLNENLEKQLSQRYVFQNKSEKKIYMGHVLLKHPCTEPSVCLSTLLSACLPACLFVSLHICLPNRHLL